MIEIWEDGTEHFVKGEPPCDGREWKSILAVAAKMNTSRAGVWYHIRRNGWTIYRQNWRRTWILKADVDNYLEFITLRKHWRKERRPKNWRMEIGIFEDEAMLKRVFLTAAQAALMMGVAPVTVIGWGQKGKIPVFKSSPDSKRKWYSPTSLRMLREDEEHLKRRMRWKQGKATQQAGIVYRQVYKLRHKPQVYAKPIPPGWITALQAAERLDLSLSTVHALQRKQRLHGRQLIKGRLEDTRHWLMPELTNQRPWFFHEDEIEEHKNNPSARRFREMGKRNYGRGCPK